ncbi:MAG: hypothetical protein JEY99_00225 [Spirochaetales bacterium]|nr:hypothetical protein [Spirochaetales bacterium]
MSGTFHKAGTFFQRGQYGEVIRLLEPQVFRFRDSYDFYYILGMSCLYTNDIGSAFTYLQRANDLESRNKNVLLALAIVHLNRRENNEALRCWLRVLEIDPKEKRATKGLNVLKSNLKKERLMDDLEEGKLDKLLPVRKKSNNKKHIRILLVIICLALIGIMIPVIFKYVDFSGKTRPDFESVEIAPEEMLLELSGDYYFILTEDQVASTVNKINDYFLSYKDNLAMREINRILLSNANSMVKDKVGFLEKNIRIPSFTDFTDNFTYKEVKSESYLYRKCYVVWKGRATNILITDENIRFDFLAGYDDEKVLEGTVTVFVSFAADITPDYPIEILAEVIPSAGGDFYLNCKAIHRLWD